MATFLRPEYYQESLKDEHDRRCVFTQPLKDDNENQLTAGDREELEESSETTEIKFEDPHKQYVAIQQGHDIPLKGLRKPAPKPNPYKGCRFSPHQTRDEMSNERLQDDFIRLQDDDVYRDFESVYESMVSRPGKLLGSCNSGTETAGWSEAGALETKALSKSLREVEESIMDNHIVSAPSPMPSIATSQLTNRADSRNTNLSYQNGPALVEEMSLSDIEDEISSSLMATKETRNKLYSYFSESEQLITNARNRCPLPLAFLHNTHNRLSYEKEPLVYSHEF